MIKITLFVLVFSSLLAFRLVDQLPPSHNYPFDSVSHETLSFISSKGGLVKDK